MLLLLAEEDMNWDPRLGLVRGFRHLKKAVIPSEESSVDFERVRLLQPEAGTTGKKSALVSCNDGVERRRSTVKNGWPEI